MLLQFSVENFLSFHEPVVFSPVAGREKQHAGHVIRDLPNGFPGVLKVAALYGANASGKTNLIRAMSYARQYVLEGRAADQPTGRKPFRLAPGTGEQPSVFTFVFAVNREVYEFGFAIDDVNVVEEWLVRRYGDEKVEPLFSRETVDGRAKVSIGKLEPAGSKQERGFLDYVARGTRPNQLFLSELRDKNVEQIQPIIAWFSSTLTIIAAGAPYGDFEQRVGSDPDFAKLLGDFLKTADTGVAALHLREKSGATMDSILPEMSESERRRWTSIMEKSAPSAVKFKHGDFTRARFARNPDGSYSVLQLKSSHLDADGQEVEFDFSEESDGTKRLAQLVPIIADTATEKSRVYVIDELDRSLHTLLCQRLIEAFAHRSRRSQLLVTTHDTNLLNSDLLRRDEIWFTEKDAAGISRLTSLWEYNVRGDLKYEKAYLQGRFGGIPLVGDRLLSVGLEPAEGKK